MRKTSRKRLSIRPRRPFQVFNLGEKTHKDESGRWDRIERKIELGEKDLNCSKGLRGRLSVKGLQQKKDEEEIACRILTS